MIFWDNINTKKIILIGTIILFIVFFAIFYISETKDINTLFKYIDNSININYDSGFYNDDISLSFKKNLYLPIGVDFYYTLNGNDPTINDNKIEDNIILNVEDNTKLYPLKVSACYKKECKIILNKNFILDKNIDDRFDIDIMSITTDEYNLYDYYNGIFVEGVTYDINSQRGAANNGYILGNMDNRGEEWERPGYLTMFDKNGNILIDQNICMGVSGWTSAHYDVKSLKLIANCYNDSKFNIDLYQNDDLYEYSLVFDYNSLRIRSGSQDRKYGNIRSSLTSILAEQSQFDGITTTKRVAVFLNGNFYGIMDLQQNYSDSFLKHKFNLPKDGEIEKYKVSENYAFKKSQIYSYFRLDLQNKNNRKILEKYVDMDNYLLYYAIEILLNNTDWPQNSCEIWRYKGDYDKNNKYTDGRYRFLIYDTDIIYKSQLNKTFFEGDNGDIFSQIINNQYHGKDSSLQYVLKSDYYKNQFILIIQDLLNTSFNENNILEILENEYNKIQKEKEFNFTNEELDIDKQSMEIMKKNISMRKKEIEKDFSKYFSLNKKYELNLETTDGIQVSWNQMNIFQNSKYNNNYYYNTYPILSAIPYYGYDFEYWDVNGEKYYDEDLIITKDLIKNNKIKIKCVAEKNKYNVVISEISAKNENDWIKLTNLTDENILLEDYYLTDNKNKINKYSLSDIIIPAYGSIYINGRKNYNSIGDYVSNFNLSYEESIYLVKNEKIIDELLIPKMNEYESYGRYDISSEYYVYFYNRNGERNK